MHLLFRSDLMPDCRTIACCAAAGLLSKDELTLLTLISGHEPQFVHGIRWIKAVNMA